MKQKITNQTTLSAILNVSGGLAVLGKYKVPCLTCPMAQIEMGSLKIGDICRAYGINSEKLLSELNKKAIL